MKEILSCPFCGETPDFPHEWYGTQYEIECDCGHACSCIQISDLMTIEERETGWNNDKIKYAQKYIDRARKEAIKQWNTRIPISKPDKCPSREIFDYWKKVMIHPRSKLDDKRRRLINRCLKNGYTADDLKKAIDGCSMTPHNMGDNDRGEKYDSIELILRNNGQIDRFMHNADNPPVGNNNNGRGHKTTSEQFMDNLREFELNNPSEFEGDSPSFCEDGSALRLKMDKPVE